MASIENHVLAQLALQGLNNHEAAMVVQSAKLMVSEQVPGVPQDWDLPIDVLHTTSICQLYISVGKAIWYLKISQVIP